jgi:hypothetical protein
VVGLLEETGWGRGGGGDKGKALTFWSFNDGLGRGGGLGKQEKEREGGRAKTLDPFRLDFGRSQRGANLIGGRAEMRRDLMPSFAFIYDLQQQLIFFV